MQPISMFNSEWKIEQRAEKNRERIWVVTPWLSSSKKAKALCIQKGVRAAPALVPPHLRAGCWCVLQNKLPAQSSPDLSPSSLLGLTLSMESRRCLQDSWDKPGHGFGLTLTCSRLTWCVHQGFWVPEEWQSCGEVCRSALRSLAEIGSQKWWIVLRCQAPAIRNMETWSFVLNWQRPAPDGFSQKDRAVQTEGTSGDFWSSLLLRAGKTAQVAQGFLQTNTPNAASLCFFFFF